MEESAQFFEDGRSCASCHAPTKIEAEQTIGAIMKAGTMFLSAGAEVYRAEETINRLGMSLPHVTSCVSYVTVTGLMCSIVIYGNTITRITRIANEDRNLSVVNAINQLSRDAEKNHYTLDQVQERLEQITHLPRYSVWTATLFAAIGTFGFAIFFNGNMAEILLSFGIGFLTRLVIVLLDNVKMNSIFTNALASFVAASLCLLCHYFYPSAKTDILIISNIMLLVPGLTLTNALRDTTMGEYLSGVARATEALIVAASIAIGVGLALYVF